MSKIGRRPISIKNLQVKVEDNKITYQGKKSSGTYQLPEELEVQVTPDFLKIVAAHKTADVNRIWGLHHALLANKLQGADAGFEEHLQIVGLGFKAVASGKKITFSLGKSHKIEYEVPADIVLEIDAKSGQSLVVKGVDKERVGLIADQIRSLRPPEPYKGVGIKRKNEVIRRKAGKTKNA